MTEFAEQQMARALALAEQALGMTRPNPMVGCVIVRDGKVIAEGYHHRAGEAHAEVDALRKLQPGEAEGADVYVNLEPCSTHGRTPPCTEALIEAKVARVIVGAVDTNPRHAGAGLHQLRAAGIEVQTGVLETQCRRLNAPYYSTMERGRPFVSAKWAMTLDGKLATRARSSEWISNEMSRQHVQHLRATHDAVLVGKGTLLHDNPRLTCRVEGAPDPIRVVIDANLEAQPDFRVFDTPGTLVAHAAGADFSEFAARGAIGLGFELTSAGHIPVQPLMEALEARNIMSVLCEGGGGLMGSLFDAGLIDRVYAFVAPRLAGGTEALSPIAGLGIEQMPDATTLSNVRVERFDEDVLIVGDIWSCSPDS